MEGPRSIRDEEVDKVVHFLNSELRPDSGWSIQDEYPTTFNPKNSRNLFIIEDEEELLSHAATRYLLLKTPQAVFKVAVIGSVVTSTNHRQKGFSQKLLQVCLEKARAEGADIAILWSDLANFYRKLGFELAGTEVSIMIDDFLPVETNDLIFREGANISPEALSRIYSQHTVSSVRTVDDIRQYLNIPNSKVYTAWNQQGQLVSYAVEGKGADLQGYIHEWGGSVSTLLPLINYIRKAHEGPLTLISPAHSVNLIQKFQELGTPVHYGHLGMIKILDYSNLMQKVHRHARSLGISNFVFTEDKGKYFVGIDQSTIPLSDQQMTNLFFGPIDENFWSAFNSENQAVLERIFPFNLWVWGWDSI